MKIKDKEKNLEIYKQQIENLLPDHNKPAIKLLFIIVEGGQANEITQLLFAAGVRLDILFKGTGTADSHLLNVLGLGTSTRDVILATISAEKALPLIKLIHNVCKMTGIVFSIRLKSVGNRNIFKLIQGEF